MKEYCKNELKPKNGQRGLRKISRLEICFIFLSIYLCLLISLPLHPLQYIYMYIQHQKSLKLVWNSFLYATTSKPYIRLDSKKSNLMAYSTLRSTDINIEYVQIDDWITKSNQTFCQLRNRRKQFSYCIVK